MSDNDDDGDVIAQDPFWSTFHRRHPDVDIVLQHEASPARQSFAPVNGDPDVFLRAQVVAVEKLWDRLVGRSGARRATQWIPGPIRGTLRCSLTLTLDEVTESEGLDCLRDALHLLPSDGWHVFAPPSGMPRINAERSVAVGDEDVLFGYSPETCRLFLRLRSTGLPVSEEQTRALMRVSS